MRRMSFAKRAKLLQFQLVRHGLLVLRSRVIALLACLTSENYIISHFFDPPE